MAPSRYRTLHRGAEEVTGEQNKSIAVAVGPLGPLISDIVEHCSPLCNVYRLRRFGIELEGLDAVDIIEMQEVKGRHRRAR